MTAPEVTELDLAGLTRLGGDDLLLFLPADVAPLTGVADLVDWQACGTLSAAVRDGRIARALASRTLLPAPEGLKLRRLLVTGLGPLAALDDVALGRCLHGSVAAARGAGGRRLVAAVPAAGPQASRREALALAMLFVRAATTLVPEQLPLLVRARS